MSTLLALCLTVALYVVAAHVALSYVVAAL
jgi:hypothetical protein